jgi:hypothetical protein
MLFKPLAGPRDFNIANYIDWRNQNMRILSNWKFTQKRSAKSSMVIYDELRRSMGRHNRGLGTKACFGLVPVKKICLRYIKTKILPYVI